MKKIVSACSLFAVAVLGFTPALSFAQTTSVQAQLDLIANLMKQIQALQQQIQGLQQQQHEATAQLVSSLRLGSEGDQVKILQALLAADIGIYPEGLITGYFGRATERAVRRLQEKFGIEQVGQVGPKTLKKLNELLADNRIVVEKDDDNANESTVAKGRVCVIVPPGHLIAPGWLRKHDGERPIVPICQTLPPGIEKKLGITPTSTPDTVAPVISSIVTTPATSTAVITWTTNESANSQVMYGLTSAYGSSTSNGALMTSHSMTLTGLMPGTVYHFSVRSADVFGNAATSTDLTFMTNALNVTDTTPPIISVLTFSAGSSTAAVSWNTNEPATGKVYYATTSTIDLVSTSTLSVSNTALSTGHLLNLSGLTASTTYYFVAQSIDASNNSATSTVQSFVTTP